MLLPHFPDSSIFRVNGAMRSPFYAPLEVNIQCPTAPIVATFLPKHRIATLSLCLSAVRILERRCALQVFSKDIDIDTRQLTIFDVAAEHEASIKAALI